MTRNGGLIILNKYGNDYNMLTQSKSLQDRLNTFRDKKLVEYNDAVIKLRGQLSDNALLLTKTINVQEIKDINNNIDYIKGQIDLIINNIKQLTTPTINNIEETHTLFLNYKYKPAVACGFEYQKTVISIKPKFGSTFDIFIPKYGDFFADMVLYLELKGLSAIHENNRVRYCNFLGHRILNSVEFYSNRVVIDSVNTEDYNIHYQYLVNPDKKALWKKCVGQELPLRGFINQDPLVSGYKIEKRIYYGNQTLKREHDTVKLLIPMIFWFNDIKNAIPNICYNGQTSLKIELASENDICSCVDYAKDGGLYKPPIISDIILYSNHIFVNDEIKNLFDTMVGETLIRVHETKKIILNRPYGKISIKEFTKPSEALFISFRPITNINGPDKMNIWNKNKIMKPRNIRIPVMMDINGNPSVGYNRVLFYEEEDVITNISLSSNDISIYADNNTLFYNGYMSYKYGNGTNEDIDMCDSMLFSFSLDPYRKEMNGYMDMDSTNDLYINYSSDFISDKNEVQVYISSYALSLFHYSKNNIKLLY